jgi:YfiH family protein
MSVPFLTSHAFEGCAGIRHGFFSRRGGISEGIYAGLNCGPGSADAPEAVAENRRRVLAALGRSGASLFTLHQVHGNRVRVITEPSASAGETAARPKADGLVTRLPGVVLGILTADCVPVLFAAPESGVIGACHAGWRGALCGILEATITAMVELGTDRGQIYAAIGPAIRQPSYEVGPEFPTPFLAENPKNRRFFKENPESGRFHFDLPGYVGQRLGAAGLGGIEDIGKDTLVEATDFFSYRRACLRGEPDYGRQISAILLDPRS